jgi:hypothetical protein
MKRPDPILLSPTFLDSFRHYQDADPEYAGKARRDLIDRLDGVPVTSGAMRKGIEFEQAVCDFLDGKADGGPAGGPPLPGIIEEAAGHVRGALRQVHVSVPVAPDVTVHGYIDFLKGNTIYDVKTTAKYEFPKYLRNCQHLAYMAALRQLGITTFKYLATDFQSLYVEEYRWDGSMLADLRGRAMDFLSYLEIDPEMKEAFERKRLRLEAA